MTGAAKFAITILLAVALIMSGNPTATAEATAEDGGSPFDSDSQADTIAVVEFTASAEFVAEFTATLVAARDHVSVDPDEPPCARFGVVATDGEGNERIGCVARWICGGERVDDLYSGELSGTDATGTYAEYLIVATNLAAANGPAAADLEIDVDLLNEDILAGNLGEPDELFQLPVFYYCRRGASGPLELDEPGYQVSFGWDTYVEAEYDLDAVSDLLIDELFTYLQARSPELQMTPPLEKRVAIVNFPSWFWVDGELPPIEISGISDQGTLLLKGRATVDHVEWTLGDKTLECTWDQMLAWDPDNHHPIRDRPHCSHVFETLDQWQLQATIHYRVEQQLSQRLGDNGAFTQGPWEPHPTRPTFTVTTDAGTIETRPIYALNVAADPSN